MTNTKPKGGNNSGSSNSNSGSTKKKPNVPKINIPLQIALSTKKDISLHRVTEKNELERVATVLENNNKENIVKSIGYSPTGKVLCIIRKKDVVLVNPDNKEQQRTIEIEGVQRSHFSTQGNLVSFLSVSEGKSWLSVHRIGPIFAISEKKQRKKKKVEEEEEEKKEERPIDFYDYKVREVYRHEHHVGIDAIWPLVQWNKDETVAAVIHRQHVRFFDELFEQTGKFTKKRCRFWGFSSQYICLYTADKPEPGIYLFGNNRLKQVRVYQPIYETLENCEIQFNDSGSHLLIKTTIEDQEGYYGKSSLYLINGSSKELVVVCNDTHVHDVRWSPAGTEFMLIKGTAPSMQAILYNRKGEAVNTFEEGAINKLFWNPTGSFICIAGMGGMRGDLHTYSNRNHKKSIGHGKAREPSTFGWSPDSRYMMTATVTPTMMVDNKLQLFKYNGLARQSITFDTLYQAIWRPRLRDACPPLIMSPRAKKESNRAKKKSTNAAAKATYVPPHLRNKK